MDERDYALLDILGQTGNITRAADRLFITQSALSKRIQGIERELDVQLLLHWGAQRVRCSAHSTQASRSTMRFTVCRISW